MSVSERIIGARTPFASIPDWVLSHKVMVSNRTALHVYSAVYLDASFASREGAMDWERIADRTGLSRPTIYRDVKALKDAGIIVKMDDGRYWMPLDPPSTTVDSGDLQSTTVDSESITVDSFGGAPLIVSNQSITEKASDSSKKKASSTYTADFEDLWKVYPRRENKKGTWDKYVATLRKGADHPTLLAAVEKYAAHCVSEDKDQKYILLGATFFGPSERWADFAPSTDPVWVPEGALRGYAELYDWYFDNGGPEDEPPWYNDIPLPRHGDSLISADGRRYKIDGVGDRVWLDA